MSYTVTRNRGCIIITGPIPINDMVALLKSWSGSNLDDDDDEEKPAIDPADVWICDSLLSGALGANLVCGTLRDTLAWRRELNIKNKES